MMKDECWVCWGLDFAGRWKAYPFTAAVTKQKSIGLLGEVFRDQPNWWRDRETEGVARCVKTHLTSLEVG